TTWWPRGGGCGPSGPTPATWRPSPPAAGSASRRPCSTPPAWAPTGCSDGCSEDGPEGGTMGDLRVGVFDHFGWAVAVAASGDHEVVDRRRLELVEPGVTPAPIHYDSGRLDVAATTALVAEVRASVARAASAALDELAAALPGPVVSISLRDWPPDFPDDIAVQRRPPYEARADAIMYRQVLAELARARAWQVHRYRAQDV